MAQGTPGNTKDCNQLQQDGQYEILSPVNGPDGFTDILIIVLAPLAKVRPDHVVQVCYDATGAALPKIRTYVTGSGWSAWAALAAGGGGGGGSTANDITADPTLWNAVFGGEPSPFDTFADISAALGGAYGTAGSVQEMLSAIEYLLLLQVLTPLSALTARNASSTVQRAITYRDGVNDPTGDYNSVNTAGASVASGTGGFFVGDTFQGGDGKLWINCGESTASPPVAVWKNLTQLS